jgi:reactive chlorine resistance protein C
VDHLNPLRQGDSECSAGPQRRNEIRTETHMSHNRATGTMADELKSSRTTAIAALIARYGLVIVIAWFGAMKFTSYESHGISHWVANSPFLGWVYDIMSIDAFGRLNGSIELIVAALLAVKPWFPKASVVGGIFASLFFATTLSFMITTPGVGEASAGGFPVLSADGEFLMKDIALIGLALWLLVDAIDATRRQTIVAETD